VGGIPLLWGFQGVNSRLTQGAGKPPKKFVFGNYIRWEDLPMVLCKDFAHGFGHDGFLPNVSCGYIEGNYNYVIIQV